MSQEKVNRYKEEKANRKQTMKKQRMMNVVRKCILVVAGVALIGWIGFSAYATHEATKEREIATINYEAIDTYTNSLAE